MADSSSQKKIPVTILTGFLGSGKTTLLNHILGSEEHGMKLAVIENEFGQQGVDEDVLVAREHSDETVIEIKNGCICCTVRGDLVESLKKIYARTRGKGKRLDGVIIETTGLADPAPVCQSFFVEPDVAKHYEIDAVITVVDCNHIVQHLEEEKPDGCENEAEEQVAFADRILLNKIDIIHDRHPSEAEREKALKAIETRIQAVNKYAPITRCEFQNKAPKMNTILGLGAFDLERVKEMDEGFLDTDAEHVHDTRVTSIGFKLGADEQIELFRLQDWISTLIKDYANDLFRYKGVIAVKGRDKKFIFQGVHMLFGGDFAGEWGDAEQTSVFCFIGKNLDKMDIEENFKKCIAKPLRWVENTKVQAKLSQGFSPGHIIKCWDEGNAYRIRLQMGVEVWAPIDDDQFVRGPAPNNPDYLSKRGVKRKE